MRVELVFLLAVWVQEEVVERQPHLKLCLGELELVSRGNLPPPTHCHTSATLLGGCVCTCVSVSACECVCVDVWVCMLYVCVCVCEGVCVCVSNDAHR